MTRRRAAHSPVKSVGAVIVGTTCKCAHSAIQGITLLLHHFFFISPCSFVFDTTMEQTIVVLLLVKTTNLQSFDFVLSPRYHIDCLASSSTTDPEDDWVCPECADILPNGGIVELIFSWI